MLQSLDGAAGCQPLSEGATHDLKVGGLAQAELEFVVSLDLGQLLHDNRVVHIDTSKARQSLGSGLVLVRLDEEAGGLGQDNHADHQDDGPGELDGDGDTVTASVIAVFG